MKKLLFFFVVFFMGLTLAFAQAPSTPLTYQSVVRNAQNQLVINQANITVTVSVWNAAGTSELYRESHSGLSTNDNGLLTLMLGSGTVNFGTWAGIDWSNASIKTVISYTTTEGTVSITSDPAPVTSVPYAIQAGNMSNITNIIGDAIHDSIVNNISEQIHDSITNYLTVGDYVTETNLCTTIESCGNVPLKNGDNTFTGANDFTGGSVTVPNAITPDLATALSSTCTKDAVSLCDLLAVFDSLNRRFNSVYDSLARLANELEELRNSILPAHAPTANVSGPTAAKPAGFKVEVTNIDPKEKTDNTTVQVCYVAKGSGECPDKESSSYTCADPQVVATPTETENIQTIYGLTPSTAYCAIVKVSNGDSTTIYGPWSVTTGEDVTMTVANDGGDTVNLCGESTKDVTFTATITGDNASDFTYIWSNGTSTTSKDTVALTADTHTITVTATHNTIEGYTLTASTSTTVNSGGTDATLKLCEEPSIDKVLVDNTDCTSLSWKNNSTNAVVSTSLTELAVGGEITAGVYTVTGVNASGCSIEKQVVLGNYNPKPCTAASRDTHSPQVAGTYTPGHGSDGLETVDASGNITSVKDIDGNEYKVVEINSQCWMAVNLRTTKYADNTPITLGTTSNSSTTDGYYYDYSSGIPLEQRGYLYNWPAAMKSTSNPEGTQGVCPSGWHLPTIVE